MIESYTVLVLGAGASAPFGFPIGKTLQDMVCDSILVQPQSNILEAIGFKKEKINDFRYALTNCGRSSVDAFLEYRTDFLDIGKTAIATALIPYEKTNLLFGSWIKKREDPEFSGGNWYESFFGELSDGVSFENFNKNQFSIVTFNYDRSFEHYLFTALKNSYNKTDEECDEMLRKIDIIHVHGSLGLLDWQAKQESLPPVPYDSKVTQEIIKLAAQNIKIVHETDVDTPEFKHARLRLIDSKKIFFLGFGYHPVNFKRLGIGTVKIKHRNIMGTSKGLSHSRKNHIIGLLPIMQQNSNLIPKDIYTFLHEHVDFA